MQMLYLYVFFDDNPRQSDTPPTPMDIGLVESGILQVFRWYFDAYEILTMTEGRVEWEKVEEAELCNDADEIGEYHA